MSRQIKGFITRDDFITPRNQDVSPIYELSETALTYSKKKQTLYPSDQQNYCLNVFQAKDTAETEQFLLTSYESSTIVRVVSEFSNYLTGNTLASKQQALINFTNMFNTMFPAHSVTNLTYNNLVTHNSVITPDYLSFDVLNISCSIWTSDEMFQTFYPGYDVDIVYPFENFINIIRNTADTLEALSEFDPVIFNGRLDAARVGVQCSTTRMMNIPYRVPGTTVERNCYFGFNIYGRNGNYEHILKLELYRVLTEVLGLEGPFVESIFPTILQINEFFITPRWNRLAIPTQVGQIGINSQVFLSYQEVFDIDHFIKIFDNFNFLKNNTYSVPFPYNNILLQVTNGYYTEEEIKDFLVNYPDLISVSSTNTDFSRMSTKTQRLMIMLENMVDVANASNPTDLFNKVVANENYLFSIIDRGGVTYLSIQFQDHQFYLIPKYQFLSLL